MAIWSKTRHPSHLSRTEKRNVIATSVGWVRRQFKGTRAQDEILVPMTDLLANTAIAAPDITDMFFDRANGYVLASANTGSVFVTFEQPVRFHANSGNARLNIHFNGNTSVAFTATANTAIPLTIANNTIRFDFQANTTGTFRILGQTVANAAANAVLIQSLNSGTANASLVFANAISSQSGTIVVT